MIKSSVEQLAELIGKDIGRSDDHTQANLLNGFFEGISDSIRDDHKLELQLCYIVDKLTPKTMKILKELYGYIEHKEK